MTERKSDEQNVHNGSLTVGRRIILLLCGGDKGAQRQDIELARIYLNDWRQRCKLQ